MGPYNSGPPTRPASLSPEGGSNQHSPPIPEESEVAYFQQPRANLASGQFASATFQQPTLHLDESKNLASSNFQQPTSHLDNLFMVPQEWNSSPMQLQERSPAPGVVMPTAERGPSTGAPYTTLLRTQLLLETISGFDITLT